MKELSLFEGAAPRVRTAPPSTSLIDLLRDRMVAELCAVGDPFALADALVLLPNRRAARALLASFATDGGATLLPAIRPLGDLDDDPDVWGPDPAGFEAPPAIDPLRRRLELAALVRARAHAEGRAEDPALALAAADELCKLLDAAATVENVDWSRLPDLVQERELAEHWRRSADFLEIITKAWPAHLAESGFIDVAARRTRLLNALAELWTRRPPQTPVIIAGSTGSVPAVRRLMAVVAGLPRGVVILPGLDSELDDRAWGSIDAGHPQFALRETLAALGVDRRAVPALTGREGAAAAARRALVREALAPADITADWLARLAEAARPWGDERAFAAAASENLLLCEGETEDEEATVAAVALREAVEAGRSAAFVTADPALARRVAAKLQRWRIEAAPSAGAPLAETPPGALITLLARLAADDGDPVNLAALAQHPLTRLAGTLAARALIDSMLRGPRRQDDLSALARAADADKRLASAAPAIEAIAGALARFGALFQSGAVDLPAAAAALAEAAEALCAPRSPWIGRAGDETLKFLHALADSGDALGPIAPAQIARLVDALMAGKSVPPDTDDDPRVAIWGPLEARMQQRDLIVIGGLNEGQWPAAAAEDPFLSASLRESLGLAPAEARIGLASHDFAQLANARNVVLTRSKRVGGAPSVASRWLWRLEAIVRAAGTDLHPPEGHNLLTWARALDAPRAIAPAQPPRPRPAARNLRIKRLSVTDVETLLRDPYAVYAKRILALAPKKDIGLRPSYPERGTAVHAALERFQRARETGAAALLDHVDAALAAGGFSPERRAGDRARLAAAADAFAAWLAARRAMALAPHLEVGGELDLGGVLLRARADRIDLKADGAADIIDFKTGAPPTDKVIKLGFSPQLPLEAAMLAAGAFEGIGPTTAGALIYWRFAASNFGPRNIDADAPTADIASAALAALRQRLAYYNDARRPFLSQVQPFRVGDVGDYDHLARRQEWVDLGTLE